MNILKSIKKVKNYIRVKITLLLMRMYAEKAIQIVHNITEENGTLYWLMFGTLLGAFREHGLIKHDDDIDLGMFAKDLNTHFVDQLVKSGFVFRHFKITSDGKYRMLKTFYHNIQVDFYGFTIEDSDCKHITGLSTQPLDGFNWSTSKSIGKYKVRLIHVNYEGVELCRFGKSKFKVLKNPMNVLIDWYGEDFMTPVKGFHKCVSTTIEVIPEEKMTARNVSYEELKLIESDLP